MGRQKLMRRENRLFFFIFYFCVFWFLFLFGASTKMRSWSWKKTTAGVERRPARAASAPKSTTAPTSSPCRWPIRIASSITSKTIRAATTSWYAAAAAVPSHHSPRSILFCNCSTGDFRRQVCCPLDATLEAPTAQKIGRSRTLPDECGIAYPFGERVVGGNEAIKGEARLTRQKIIPALLFDTERKRRSCPVFLVRVRNFKCGPQGQTLERYPPRPSK